MKTIIKRIFLAGMATVIIAVGSTDASARRVYRDHGFYAGIAFAGSFIDVNNEAGSTLSVTQDGNAVDLRVGYSFNPVFSLELALAGARHDTSDPAIDVEFSAVKLFGVYRFRPSHQMRPYLKGGLGGYSLRMEDPPASAEATGGGLAFGGGLDYFFSRHFSLGLDYTFNLIEYDAAKLNFENISVSTQIDENGAQSALGLTFSFYF
jgi:opacity protein-like surface antigen